MVSRISRCISAVLLLGSLVGFAHAQGGSVSLQIIQPPPPSGTGGPAPFATVRVCPYPSGSGTPCSPLSSLFQDPGLTIPATNPATSDQYGNVSLWVSPGPVIVQVTPVNGVVYSYLQEAVAGTLTTVGLSMPGIFNVANTPLTGTGGTLAVTFAPESPNLVLGTCGNSIITFCAIVPSQLPSILNAITTPSINGELNPAICGTSAPASWCSGSDIGAWINAALATFPNSCGEIYIPTGTFNQTTTVVMPRCAKIHGASAMATRLIWNNTAGWAFVVGDNNTALDFNYSYEGALEDLSIVGPSASNTAGGVYLGGSDGQPNSPPTSIDPSTNFGDHFNLNRVRVFQPNGLPGFSVGVQIGENAWSDTIFESVLSFCGTGFYAPPGIGSHNSGEEISIVNSSVSNNTGIGVTIGTGSFVNLGIVGSSLDFNGAWAVQNGTTASQNAVSLINDYIDVNAQKFIQNYGYIYASGGYWNGGAGGGSGFYLIDNELPNNFTISGGQIFNNAASGSFVFNQSGQCVTVTGTFMSGPGSYAWPVCTYVDTFGNASFISSVTTSGVNAAKLNQAFGNYYAGVSACIAGTLTFTFPAAYNNNPAVVVSDETTKGGANVTSRTTAGFTVSCTGATDTFDWIAIGNPN